MQSKLVDLYLSTACGAVAIVKNGELKHSRRYRKLCDIEERLMNLLLEYECAFDTRESLELASNVITMTEFNLRKDLENDFNDGSEM